MVVGTYWNNIFVHSVFLERVKLSPRDLHAGYVKALTRSLRESFEGKCTKYGYIKRGSIDVVQVYMGSVEAQTFRGFTNFTVKFKADVCNPTLGAVVVAKVQNINGFGILCTCGYVDDAMGGGKYVPILEIITPKHTQSIKSEVDLSSVKVGDEVNVEIMGKKFELMDTKISTIGRIVKKVRDTQAINPLYDGEAPEDGAAEGVEDDVFDLEGDFYADSKDGDGEEEGEEDDGEEEDEGEEEREGEEDDDVEGDEEQSGGAVGGGSKAKKITTAQLEEVEAEKEDGEDEEEDDVAEVDDEDAGVEDEGDDAEEDFYVE